MQITPEYGARVRPTMALPSYLAKRRRNKLIILALLILLLLLIGFFFARLYFAREAPVPLVEEARGPAAIVPPAFLFAITGGPGNLALKQPLGVAVDPSTNRIYVTSFIPGTRPALGRIEVFDAQGNYLYFFNEIKRGETLVAPTHVAISKTGRVYVSDRRLKGVFIFSKGGKFISKFVPNNDPNFVWDPLAIAFDKDNNLYVSDIYSSHRVLVFTPEGKLKLTFGDIGLANKKGEKLGLFHYPNSIVVDRDGKIFVADSNNRRVQVFNKKGKFISVFETGGLPRGIDIDERNYLYVSDALSHDMSIFDKRKPNSTALATVGGMGIDFGQFLFPNGLATGPRGRIYVTDRENNRVQVWGWPAVAAVPAPIRRAIPIIVFLLPFILYALWRAIRRRRHLASQDFMSKIIENNQLNKTKDKLKKVFVSPNTYEALKGYKEYDLEIERVIKPIKVDEELVKDFQKTHEVSEETATLFVRAQRGLVKPRLFSEGAEVHATAQKLNVESMDHPLFVEYYHVK